VLHLYDKQGIGKNLNDPVKEKRKSEKITFISQQIKSTLIIVK
jgi:hypothetical protein